MFVSLEVLNPAGEVKVKKQLLLKRDKNLQGKILTLFSNDKPNVDVLFDGLTVCFTESSAVKKINRKGKQGAALSAPEDLLREVARESDLVICAVGD